MTEKLLVTYAEAAEMLSVDERTVRRLAANDDIALVNLGKRCPRIVVESIHEYVAFLQQSAYNETVGLAMRDSDPGDSTWPDAKTKTASTREKIRPTGGQATQTQAANIAANSTSIFFRRPELRLQETLRIELLVLIYHRPKNEVRLELGLISIEEQPNSTETVTSMRELRSEQAAELSRALPKSQSTG